MTHTPVPWRYDLIGAVVDADDRALATLVGERDGSLHDANGHVIAAAPALLEACQEALLRASMSDLLRDQLRAAIAQAKGE